MQDKCCYLMTHFIGEQEDGEQVYFSVSEDGLHWQELNQGKFVLKSTIGTMGVRDPFIIRDEIHDKFVIIATDLQIHAGKGWEAAVHNGSRSLVVWESKDLITWSEPKLVTMKLEAGCLWAPEAIYDHEKKAYLVFWASNVRNMKSDGHVNEEKPSIHKMYASYTEDFYHYTEPFLYIERSNDVIDTTIAYEAPYYYRFTKDEATKYVIADRGKSLTGPFENIEVPALMKLKGVEGPATVYLEDRQEWLLMVDQFAEGKGYLPMTAKSLDKHDFKIVDEDDYDMGKTIKRHGSLIRITREEYHRLMDLMG